MRYGGKYWNIKDILPYQRNFNFINSLRGTGKTYTSAGFTMDRFLKFGEQSMLVVRTVDEKKQGALQKWYEKVLAKEFPSVPVKFTSSEMYYTPEKDKETWRVIARCRALSEAVKVKKQSFVGVRWMFMEEYMLEPKHQDLYVKGWEEPNLFLNLYHTVDREEDYVTCFLLGNNTAFYNPYHLHPAFQIPPQKPGAIWKSENVLFQWYEPTKELKEEKENNKFLNMIRGTEYGRYAVEGRYIGDNESFVAEKTGKANFVFMFKFDSMVIGVWFDYHINKAFISDKHNPASGICLSLDAIEDEGDRRVNKRNSLVKWLARLYVSGRVYYESMEIKLKVEKIIQGRML